MDQLGKSKVLEFINNEMGMCPDMVLSACSQFYDILTILSINSKDSNFDVSKYKDILTLISTLLNECSSQ